MPKFAELSFPDGATLQDRPRGSRAGGGVADWLRELVVGSVHVGEVVERRNYGVMVRIGPAVGLCHVSEMEAVGRALNSVQVGIVYEFEVLSRDPERRRMSLRLLRPGERPASFEQDATRASGAGVTGAVVGGSAAYASGIHAAIKEGAATINAVGAQNASLKAPNRAGYVAEADHAATFNTDAAFRRSGLRAERPPSTVSKVARSPDLTVTDGAGRDLGAASSKVYKDAKSTARAQRGYGKQDRIVPTDQLDEVRKHARGRAAAERASGKPNCAPVAEELDEVADRATDRLRRGETESTPRTRAESKRMGQKARRGAVDGRDIVGDAGRRVKEGATQGAKAGAVAGAAVTAVVETFSVVQRVRRGEASVKEAAVHVGVAVAKGTVDGGIKGAAGGAATAAAQVAAQKVGSAALKAVLKGNAPAAAAVVGVDVARHAIRLATGAINGEEFKRAAGEAVRGGAASYIGSAIGGALGGPAGMIVGGIAGSLLASKAAEVGLLTRLERTLSSSTATGHDDSEAYHLEQRAAVARAIRSSRAAAFFDRVVPTRDGGHLSVGAVILTGEHVLAVDVRGWRGHLAFPAVVEERTERKSFLGLFEYNSVEEIETDEDDDGVVVQTKVSGGGHTFEKVHPNPVRRLNAASRAMKAWLSNRNRAWAREWITPVVVFSAEEVELAKSLRDAPGFFTLKKFAKQLAEESHAPRAWMLDDLAMTPTWDVLVDGEGTVYQGLIQQESFRLLVDGGKVDVPYTSLLKVDVVEGGFLSRADAVQVTLRTGEPICGFVEKEEITISRMGYERSFLLRDLVQVCPASSYFTLDLRATSKETRASRRR